MKQLGTQQVSSRAAHGQHTWLRIPGGRWSRQGGSIASRTDGAARGVCARLASIGDGVSRGAGKVAGQLVDDQRLDTG